MKILKYNGFEEGGGHISSDTVYSPAVASPFYIRETGPDIFRRAQTLH